MPIDNRHIINLDDRQKARISGVLEVVSFDEDGVVLESECGLLVIKGSGFRMGKLDLETGDVIIEGLVESVNYANGALNNKTSLLGKLFR